MIEEYIDRIVFLETDGSDAVYAQREQELQRMPFEMERIILRFVAEGKPKEMIDIYKQVLVGQYEENKEASKKESEGKWI